MAKKYESQRGIYHVEVSDGKAVVEVRGNPLLKFDTVEELIDLFVATASVLNQVYDNDEFRISTPDGKTY